MPGNMRISRPVYSSDFLEWRDAPIKNKNMIVNQWYLKRKITYRYAWSLTQKRQALYMVWNDWQFYITHYLHRANDFMRKYIIPKSFGIPWWRHQMEAFSALLALCAGNSPVTGEFPSQRPVTRSFDVFFDLRLNKQLSKQSRGWWFETPSPDTTILFWPQCVKRYSRAVSMWATCSWGFPLTAITMITLWSFPTKFIKCQRRWAPKIVVWPTCRCWWHSRLS